MLIVEVIVIGTGSGNGRPMQAEVDQFDRFHNENRKMNQISESIILCFYQLPCLFVVAISDRFFALPLVDLL